MSAQWVVGDTTPALGIQLLSDNLPVDLTDATAITLRSNDDQGHGLKDVVVQVVDATQGMLSYTWQPGDNAVAGTYWCAVSVTWIDGSKQTLPNTGPAKYQVLAQVPEPN